MSQMHFIIKEMGAETILSVESCYLKSKTTRAYRKEAFVASLVEHLVDRLTKDEQADVAFKVANHLGSLGIEAEALPVVGRYEVSK